MNSGHAGHVQVNLLSTLSFPTYRNAEGDTTLDVK